jgi:hypothetical protein
MFEPSIIVIVVLIMVAFAAELVDSSLGNKL